MSKNKLKTSWKLSVYDVKLPKAPENAAKWSKERLDTELEKGYNDMLKGRTRPAAMVLSDVKKKYKV